MISILKPKLGESKRNFHIRQISLIEILFHSEQFLMWLQELKYALSLGYLYPQLQEKTFYGEFPLDFLWNQLYLTHFPNYLPHLPKGAEKYL